MNRTLRVTALIAGLTLAASSSLAWGQTLSSFTATYKASSTSSCGSTYNIQGKEPSAAGTYPVYLHLVGTNEGYDSAHAMLMVDSMASRGYVAATVQYPNGSFGSCSTLSTRSRCVFNAASANSAVSKLCSRAKADCSKGIVASGFSQGSVLATLGKDYDARVRAVYGQGIGVQYSFYDLRACMADGNHTLSSDRLRAVTGEVDGFMGSSQSSTRGQMQELTGLNCGSTATACANANGSGWKLVVGSEVKDGTADHCYMYEGGCTAGSRLDPNWTSGTAEWTLNYNLDWLSGFTD